MMKPLLYITSALAVMALAFWAYRENYATQRALRDLTAAQDAIANLREEIAMQKAEWAYLNRPERLRELATANFDSLQLLPLEPDQLGDAQSVAFPAPAGPALGADAGKLIITGTSDTKGAIMPKSDDKAFP